MCCLLLLCHLWATRWGNQDLFTKTDVDVLCEIEGRTVGRVRSSAQQVFATVVRITHHLCQRSAEAHGSTKTHQDVKRSPSEIHERRSEGRGGLTAQGRQDHHPLPQHAWHPRSFLDPWERCATHNQELEVKPSMSERRPDSKGVFMERS